MKLTPFNTVFRTLADNRRTTDRVPHSAQAKALGISRGHFSQLYNGGIVQPTLSTVAALARYYRVPLETFLETFLGDKPQ